MERDRSIEFRATERETEYDDDDDEVEAEVESENENLWIYVPIENNQTKSNNLKKHINDRNPVTNEITCKGTHRESKGTNKRNPRDPLI